MTREKRWRHFLVPLVTPLLIGLALLFERLLGTFELSHLYAVGGVLVLTLVFWWLRNWWKWLVDLVGMEGESHLLPRLEIGLFGAFFLSIYLLIGSTDKVLSPALQFSIIPVTATLGGLVIAGANYSQIRPDQRSELLKVAQKLVVATICFIFFTSSFFLANAGGNVDPNHFPSSMRDITKFVLFWFAALLFLTGTCLFVIGIIDLALELKTLKKPPVEGD